MLTADERLAVEQFVSLGATLIGDFTDGELRSAYRTLARQYHPDRHPQSSPVEKARLSRAFSNLCDAYRRLQAGSAHAAVAA